MGIDARGGHVRRIALDWTIRVQDEGFADWDGLTDWLDADPSHAEWFDRLTVRDAEAADRLREMPPPVMPGDLAYVGCAKQDTALPSRDWMRLAAGLALPVALSGGWLLHDRLHEPRAPAATIMNVATRPAEQRAVTLADGTRIAVAGATRLSIDFAARRATLLTGRATFRVIHDAARPFSVRLGDVTVTDVGTVFDLHRSDGGAEIAVAEGIVQLDRAGADRRVHAGQIVRLTDGAPAQMGAIAPADVGSWKDGRFDYADASIAEIAADLTAATGVPVRAAPDVASERFGGSIRIAGDTDHALHALAPFLGVSVRRVGAQWELGRPADADRR
jgi:transmembrane sensor